MTNVQFTVRLVRRIAVAVAGMTILAIGVVMIVTPGPAIVVIPVGLAILGLEFAWARVWLQRLRKRISNGNSNQRADRAEDHRNRSMRE